MEISEQEPKGGSLCSCARDKSALFPDLFWTHDSILSDQCRPQAGEAHSSYGGPKVGCVCVGRAEEGRGVGSPVLVLLPLVVEDKGPAPCPPAGRLRRRGVRLSPSPLQPSTWTGLGRLARGRCSVLLHWMNELLTSFQIRWEVFFPFLFFNIVLKFITFSKERKLSGAYHREFTNMTGSPLRWTVYPRVHELFLKGAR